MALTNILSAAIVFGVISAGGAFAQTGAGTPAPANQPVVSATNPDSKTATAPVAGANSFTEAQARSRLEEHGYLDVGVLTKDDQSVWRGKAKKNGSSVDVALDYQGNIVSRQ
jgi:hypothetical protein